MTTQELAKKKGVTMPKNSIKLGFNLFNSLAYWFYNEHDDEWIFSERADRNYYEFECQFTPIAAPQIHEIMAVLPMQFISFRGGDNAFCFDNHEVRYTQDIHQENFADALAELYLFLKSKDLL